MAQEKKPGKKKGGGKKKDGTYVKKKSRGSKTGSRKVVLLDGAPITDLTREQLILRLEHIILELEREREERVYFQAERNKLHEIWEAAKQKCQETESQVLCLERDMESGNAAYRSQITEQRQRQAWLLQQHQITLTEFQLKNQEAIEEFRSEALSRETELIQKIEELKIEQRSQALKSTQEIILLKKAQGEEIVAIQEKCETRVRDVTASSHQNMERHIEQMKIHYEKEVEDLKERHRKQNDRIKATHENTLEEISDYNKEIVESQQVQISSLKEENQELNEALVKSKKRVLLLEKDLTEVKNKLNLLEDARDALKKYKEGFSSALMSLEKIRDDQKKHKEKYDKLCIEAEGRNQKLIKCELEKEKIREQLLRVTLELQQKTTLRKAIKGMTRITSSTSSDDSSY
ncbi:hypothetical protein QYM36_001375 [Artemia franciscana]|uniref:Dynein regulatory complex subunit 4 n=1 Tax=Artemia franciscana TaxID=6661 RepID=A0AA88I959_ARTSF|nr:hypothetical protein QYM36_001375 [Artemia franciscana]KAK2724883.1 hypothetical protein QYM36_001375 [Artemia franciscana]